MKTIKTLFAILFLSTMFIACDTDTVNDEVGIEVNDQIGEEEDEELQPGARSAYEEEDEELQPGARSAYEEEDEELQPGNQNTGGNDN